MAPPVQEPSEASRLAGVAEAGMGADESEHTARLAGDGSSDRAKSLSPGGSSEDVAEPKKEEKPAAPQRSKLKTALIMLSLCIAVFLAALDMTIVTTAIPTITSRFHASEADYTWIGSAYLLAAAASTPTWGKFSDIWGRKPIVLFANAIFLLGSLISATSVNVKMLIGGRVIQGIGGGGLIILANICISDLFSMRERGKYFGFIGMVWGIASAIGPVLGGIFTEKVSWRWCFYINLPFDGLAFVIILFLLDIEIPKSPLLASLKAIDWIGCITIVGGTLMFLLGLEYGGVNFPWKSATVICLIVFGLVTLTLFFLNEWRLAVYPVMPLRLFSRRSNIAALMVCFCHGTVFIAASYFLPLYFQSVYTATPILSGVYTFPFVLSMSFTSMGTGIYIKKTGQYLPPIWLGMAFMTLGFGLFIDLPNRKGSWDKLIIYQIIAGLGVGPNFQAPLIALQSLIEPRDIASATATFGFVRNLATSISVVIGGVIFQNGMSKHARELQAALGPQVGSALGGGSAGASTNIVQSLPPTQRNVATSAYTASLRTMWYFYVAIAVLGICCSAAIGRNKLSKQHQIQKQGLAEQERLRAEDKRLSQSRKSGGDVEKG